MSELPLTREDFQRLGRIALHGGILPKDLGHRILQRIDDLEQERDQAWTVACQHNDSLVEVCEELDTLKAQLVTARAEGLRWEKLYLGEKVFECRALNSDFHPKHCHCVDNGTRIAAIDKELENNA